MKIKIITSLKLLLCLISFTAYSQPKNPFAYYTFDGAGGNPIITPATLPLPYISSTGCTFCGIKLIPTSSIQVIQHNTGQINTDFYQSTANSTQTSTLDGWGTGTNRMDASASDAITVELLVRFDKSAVLQRKASLFNLTEVNGDEYLLHSPLMQQGMKYLIYHLTLMLEIIPQVVH